LPRTASAANSAKVEGPLSYQAVIKACLVASVPLIQTYAVTTGLLLLVGYVLKEVVGRAMKGQEDPAKDRNKIPCMGQTGPARSYRTEDMVHRID